MSAVEMNKEAAVVYQDPDKPPLEAPYLLSTMRSINLQRDHARKMQNAWNQTYPTWKGDHAAKMAWIRNLESNNIDPSKHEGIFDVRDIIKEILAQDCRTPINVQLIVRKEKLADFKIIKVQGKSNIYDEHNVPGTTKADAVPKNASAMEMFVVASEKVATNARMDMVVPRLLMRIGLPIDAEVVPALPQLARNNVPNFSREWPEFAHEGIHFPGNLPHKESSVAFEVVSLNHSLSEYERNLREIANSRPDENPDFILVAKNPSTVSPASRDTHYVLWYSLRIEFEHCKHHIRSGIGEIDILRWKLKKNNDNSNIVERCNLRLEVVHAEISYIKKIPGRLKLQRKLSRLLALTIEIKNTPEIIYGCSKPQLAKKCIADVADLWRIHLLKPDLYSDTALGLAPTGKVSDGVESRTALFTLLESVEKDIGKGHINSPSSKKKISFNWRPTASLKRPATATLAQNEIIDMGTSQSNHKMQRTSGAGKNPTVVTNTNAVSGGPAVADPANIVNTSVAPVSAPEMTSVYPTAVAATTPTPGVNRAASITTLGITPAASTPVVIPTAVPRVVINTVTVPGTQLPPGAKGGLKGGSSAIASSGNGNLTTAPSVTPSVMDGLTRSPATELANATMELKTMNVVPVTVQSIGVSGGGESIGSFVNTIGRTKIPKLAQRQSPKGPKQYVPAGIGAHDGNRNNNYNNNDVTVARALVRPSGRAPHDRNGKKMIWMNGVWKSATNDAEIRPPNLKPRPPPTSPDAMSSRPVGRAPHDSHGKRMLWNPQLNVWVSTKDPEEIKTPKPRQVPGYNTAAIMQSMLLPPSKKFQNNQPPSSTPIKLEAVVTVTETAMAARHSPSQLETKNNAETGVELQCVQPQVGVAAGCGEMGKGNPPAKKAFGPEANPTVQQPVAAKTENHPNPAVLRKSSSRVPVPPNTSPIISKRPSEARTPAVPAQELSHADLSALDAAIQSSDSCTPRMNPVASQLNSTATRTTMTHSDPANATGHMPQLSAVSLEALSNNRNSNTATAQSHASIQIPADSKATDPIFISIGMESHTAGCMEMERWDDSLNVDISKINDNVDGDINSLFGDGVIPTRRM